MKNFILRLSSLALVIIASCTFVSCNKENPKDIKEDPQEIPLFLFFGNLPTSFGDGEEVTVSVEVKTNVPVVDLITETPEWITTSTGDGVLTAVVSSNRTIDVREGEVVLKDQKNRVKPVSFHVTQDWLLVIGEGMVQFKDKAFKKAILAIADADKDLDISMDEAKTIREVDAVGKGIVDITGIECFSSIEKLVLRNNDIRRVWLDDPAVFSHLKYVDLCGNNNLDEELNVSGCYVGGNFSLSIDNRSLYSIIYDEPRYYESSDYSQNGLHRIREHTKGNGIHLGFLTTEYVDVDYNSGAVRELVEYQEELLFSVEPFSSMKEYFDISHFALVARNIKERAKITDYSEALEEYKNIADDETKYHIVISVNTDGNPLNGRAYGHKFDLMSWPGIVGLVERRKVETVKSRPIYTITHEMGHAVGGLEDEYEEERERDNYSPNYTIDLSYIPWQRFLDSILGMAVMCPPNTQ